MKATLLVHTHRLYKGMLQADRRASRFESQNWRFFPHNIREPHMKKPSNFDPNLNVTLELLLSLIVIVVNQM